MRSLPKNKHSQTQCEEGPEAGKNDADGIWVSQQVRRALGTELSIGQVPVPIELVLPQSHRCVISHCNNHLLFCEFTFMSKSRLGGHGWDSDPILSSWCPLFLAQALTVSSLSKNPESHVTARKKTVSNEGVPKSESDSANTTEWLPRAPACGCMPWGLCYCVLMSKYSIQTSMKWFDLTMGPSGYDSQLENLEGNS